MAALALLLAGCGSPAPAPQPPQTTGPLLPAPSATAGPGVSKVLTVVLENHSQIAAVDGMPYLAGLADTYGRTTHYRAVKHPSLPNYLAMAGGSTFGVDDDDSPSEHHLDGPTVFDQAIAAGKTAKTYAESMPSACATSGQDDYAVKHNPWAYFDTATSRVNCRRYDVPAGTTSAGALHDDIVAGGLPTIGLLVPNLCNDAHNCSLATADDWLEGWLEQVEAGPDWATGRLALIVTFDEDDSDGDADQDNTVLTTVISPYTHHVVSTADYTHYSWTRYIGELIGAPPLRHAESALSLGPEFGI